ncbi:MAG: hypothetical protein NTV63_03535 [Candidatus Woesearchaeota archaeon]|nr:hypothetical protein [Candidatus Woesearchaeota archaeon]
MKKIQKDRGLERRLNDSENEELVKRYLIEKAALDSFSLEYRLFDGNSVRIEKNAYSNAENIIKTVDNVVFEIMDGQYVSSEGNEGMEILHNQSIKKREIQESAFYDFCNAKERLDELSSGIKRLVEENGIKPSKVFSRDVIFNLDLYSRSCALTSLYLRFKDAPLYKETFSAVLKASNLFHDYFIMAWAFSEGRKGIILGARFPVSYLSNISGFMEKSRQIHTESVKDILAAESFFQKNLYEDKSINN